MHFKSEPTVERLKFSIKNIYMMAKRKRSVIHRYEKDGTPIPIGPASDDSDWDHVIRFCELTGVTMDVVRLAEMKSEIAYDIARQEESEIGEEK